MVRANIPAYILAQVMVRANIQVYILAQVMLRANIPAYILVQFILRANYSQPTFWRSSCYELISKPTSWRSSYHELISQPTSWHGPCKDPRHAMFRHKDPCHVSSYNTILRDLAKVSAFIDFMPTGKLTPKRKEERSEISLDVGRILFMTNCTHDQPTFAPFSGHASIHVLKISATLRPPIRLVFSSLWP